MSTSGKWSYEKVEDGFGYLRGPNKYKFGVCGDIEIIGPFGGAAMTMQLA